MPIAAPPGATIESAVDACVIASACRKRRPGSVTIHGGANVARLSAVAPTSTATHCHVRVLIDVPDVAVVRDLRQGERERDDDDRDAGPGERVAAPARPLLLAELGCAVRRVDAAHACHATALRGHDPPAAAGIFAPMEMMGNESMIWEGHPTWRAMLSFHIKWFAATLVLFGLLVLAQVGRRRPLRTP